MGTAAAAEAIDFAAEQTTKRRLAAHGMWFKRKQTKGPGAKKSEITGVEATITLDPDNPSYRSRKTLTVDSARKYIDWLDDCGEVKTSIVYKAVKAFIPAGEKFNAEHKGKAKAQEAAAKANEKYIYGADDDGNEAEKSQAA